MEHSFRTLNGEDIYFENIRELSLDEIRDVATNEVTGYLVTYNDQKFRVNEETYNALSNL